MFILSVYEPPTLAGGRYTSMELLYDHLTRASSYRACGSSEYSHSAKTAVPTPCVQLSTAIA